MRKFDLRLDMQLLSLQQRARRHAVVNSLAKNASVLSKKSLCDMERYGSTEFANRVWHSLATFLVQLSSSIWLSIFGCPARCSFLRSRCLRQGLRSPTLQNVTHTGGVPGVPAAFTRNAEKPWRRSEKRKQDEEEVGKFVDEDPDEDHDV